MMALNIKDVIGVADHLMQKTISYGETNNKIG